MTESTTATTTTTTPAPARKPQKRTGGERRGNSTDRARRRRNMLDHWGNGRFAPCQCCGRPLYNYPRGCFAGGIGPADHIEADKVVPHEDGPGYRMSNVYPSCRECNLARGDRDLADFLGADRAAAIAAHAASYRPRRGRR